MFEELCGKAQAKEGIEMMHAKRLIIFCVLLLAVLNIVGCGASVIATGGIMDEPIAKGDIGYTWLDDWQLASEHSVIYDESYEQSALSHTELHNWYRDESKGEFCEYDANLQVKALSADGDRLYVDISDGECVDFDGWIPLRSFVPDIWTDAEGDE